MIKRKSITINSALNIIRQLCAVLFPLITFPYATRILGTEYYGRVSFGLSVISYIALVASLGVFEYAVREGAKIRDDRKSFQQFAVQVFSINILSTLVAIIILAFLIVLWNKLSGYAVLLLILSLSVISTTFGADWINSVYEDYLYITLRYIVIHIATIVFMFVFVKSSDDYLIYAFTTISTVLFSNIINTVFIRKKYNIHLRFTLNIDYKKHLKPIMIMFGSSIAAYVYINSDVIILGAMKDPSVVGVYYAGSRVYIMVKQILNAALAVAIPRVANNIASGIDNEPLLQRIRKISLMMLVPASIGLFLTGDKIINLLSGADYAEAGTVLRILAIALFFATSGCYYISVVMIPYGKERLVLVATIVSAVVNIVLNYIFIPNYGGLAAAWTTVVSEMIMMICGLISTRNIIKIRPVKNYLVCILCALTLFAISTTIDRFFSGNTSQLVLTVVLGVVSVALIELFFFHKEIRVLINELFKHA